MKSSIRSLVVMAVLGAAAVVAAVPAQAEDSASSGHAVFVQTNDPRLTGTLTEHSPT